MVVHVNVCPRRCLAGRGVQTLKVLLHMSAKWELTRVSETGDSDQVLHRIRHEGIGRKEHTLGSAGPEYAMFTDANEAMDLRHEVGGAEVSTRHQG